MSQGHLEYRLGEKEIKWIQMRRQKLFLTRRALSHLETSVMLGWSYRALQGCRLATVIYVQAFILVILMGKLMRKVFFGQLRAAEFEHLMERSWYAITETCLAFTVFRDDFSPKFVALFTVLLFLKSFHWLAEDRVDFMERSPDISWLFHIRVL
ncbi:unnamed protein product, partial [Timema podura]|nr:unnamed protein product [Timema podura]